MDGQATTAPAPPPLPMEVEPASFLVALERQAADAGR